MTRTLTAGLGALAIVSTLALGTATPTLAQGVYIGGPGFAVGVGPRWHHRYYRDYDDWRPYHRYWRHRYYRYHEWD